MTISTEFISKLLSITLVIKILQSDQHLLQELLHDVSVLVTLCIINFCYFYLFNKLYLFFTFVIIGPLDVDAETVLVAVVFHGRGEVDTGHVFKLELKKKRFELDK